MESACRWLPYSSADDWFFNSPRVHFMRNVLAHAGKSGRRVVSAFIATAFAQETPEAASAQWRAVADQIRPKVPKLAAIMDDAEEDVLAYMTFSKEHRAKLHSTTRSSASTAKSSAGPRSSASSPMMTPSSASSERSCSSRTTNGLSNAPDT
ncbi:hypothetical protein BHMPCIPO_05736 [Ensifer sesbaniae]|nr:hypothetical protein [Ensifer sesbaniae]